MINQMVKCWHQRTRQNTGNAGRLLNTVRTDYQEPDTCKDELGKFLTLSRLDCNTWFGPAGVTKTLPAPRNCNGPRCAERSASTPRGPLFRWEGSRDEVAAWKRASSRSLHVTDARIVADNRCIKTFIILPRIESCRPSVHSGRLGTICEPKGHPRATCRAMLGGWKLATLSTV